MLKCIKKKKKFKALKSIQSFPELSAVSESFSQHQKIKSIKNKTHQKEWNFIGRLLMFC
jgi:hypothetical protein